MVKTHKTKTEMLQELESIKGLLLENDDIPLLQEVEVAHQPVSTPLSAATTVLETKASEVLETKASEVLETKASEPPSKPLSHTQTSLFDDDSASHSTVTASTSSYDLSAPKTPEQPYTAAMRQPVKAAGENPFLPQHIRERLHGNNPPPLFANVTARKIMNATKSIQPKNQRPRQQLIDEVITSMLPQIESELRHRLFAMSTDELESLLKNQE